MSYNFRLTKDQTETLRMALVRALVASERYIEASPEGPKREGYQAQLASILELCEALNPQMPDGLNDLALKPPEAWRRRRLPPLH